MPTISIIIPCYNLGGFLLPCLESVARQPADNVEYIFIDDGSTDDTYVILKQFGENKRNTVILRQENQGVSVARNNALNHCCGKYIYLLDGDDILTDESVTNMINAVKSNCDAILSPASVKKDGSLSTLRLPVPSGEYTPIQFYQICRVFPTMPKLLYKREIILKYGLNFEPSLKTGEVYEFTIRFLNYASSIKVIPACLFHYVMRSSSATHKPNFDVDLSVLNTLRSYYQHGEKFKNIPSFNTTAFKMMMSFTYNKYVKLRLCDKKTFAAIEKLLTDPLASQVIKSVVKSNRSPFKERLLAFWIQTTGITGYKLLAKIL